MSNCNKLVTMPVAVALMLFVGGAACAADATAPPAAGPVLTDKTLVVKVGDLDLATDSGVKVAYDRVLNAARKACNYTTVAGDYVVGRREVYRACLDRTIAEATARLEQLRLAALPRPGAKGVGIQAAEATHTHCGIRDPRELIARRRKCGWQGPSLGGGQSMTDGRADSPMVGPFRPAPDSPPVTPKTA